MASPLLLLLSGLLPTGVLQFSTNVHAHSLNQADLGLFSNRHVLNSFNKACVYSQAKRCVSVEGGGVPKYLSTPYTKCDECTSLMSIAVLDQSRFEISACLIGVNYL